MTELWLVRHGQTDWNLEGRYQGQEDVPLNAAGEAQARQLAADLDGRRFTAIYSSDMKRARRTAQILAGRLGLTVQIDRRLREISMGEWEGLLFPEVKEKYPLHIQERRQNPLHARSPGGETALEVAGRMAQAVDEIVRKHPEGPLLIVSHGFALATLICQARGLSVGEAYRQVPENAVPQIVEWDINRQPLVEKVD